MGLWCGSGLSRFMWLGGLDRWFKWWCGFVWSSCVDCVVWVLALAMVGSLIGL